MGATGSQVQGNQNPRGLSIGRVHDHCCAGPCATHMLVLEPELPVGPTVLYMGPEVVMYPLVGASTLLI